MLKFAVFDDKGAAKNWPLRHAFLLGQEEAALGGDISFQDGLICCRRRGEGSAALSLQYDAGPAGRLLLDTCLLPNREKPYLLSLELARKRIMLSLMKLEDWQLFDEPESAPAMRALRDAHTSFMRALSTAHGEFTAEHDRLARDALQKAIAASEQLTLRDAERRLSHRLSDDASDNPRPPSPKLGCVVRADRFTAGLRNIVGDSFDFMSLPLPWRELEPEEGMRYRFQPFDQWIEWAVRKARAPVAGGPLIDFRAASVPEWLYIWENDYETLRELVYEHVKRVVTRYRRAVSHWTVVSGLNVNRDFTLSLEQVVDLTRLCALVVRKLQKNARVQVEVTQPFGEYSAHNQHSIPPLLYTELLFQAGVSVDSIGIRLEMGDAAPGHATHDLARIASMLDEFCEFDKPLSVSSAGVPSQPSPEESFGEDGAFDPGYWRRQWSQQIQAEWLAAVTQTALARPQVTSVVWAELYDGARAGSLQHGGLITEAGQPKTALRRVADLRARLRAGRSIEDLAEAPAVGPEPKAESKPDG